MNYYTTSTTADFILSYPFNFVAVAAADDDDVAPANCGATAIAADNSQANERASEPTKDDHDGQQQQAAASARLE